MVRGIVWVYCSMNFNEHGGLMTQGLMSGGLKFDHCKWIMINDDRSD